MKIILILTLVLSFGVAAAQDSDLFHPEKRRSFSHVSFSTSGNEPLFVYKLGNKVLEFPDENNYKDSTLAVYQLKNDWIESINILKDSSVIRPYGIRATYGVVIIEFKTE